MCEKSKNLEQVRKFVCSAMEANDPAHDGTHVLRVVKLTRQLLQMCPQADRFRAELLAWLHDMNDDKLATNLGLGSLAVFLTEIGTEKADIDFVLGGIPYISYRKHPHLGKEIPLEIRIVQDADRIDAMGAMGIARTFAFGGAKNRHLDESLAHFDEKLLKLYDLLGTEEAKALAKPRWEFLKAFYRQYNEENTPL